MYRELLRDAPFLALLLRIDLEKLERVRAEPCPLCGGPLHLAHFERKPRGPLSWPEAAPDGYGTRFDLCCGWCRHRTMPASVRFLGRKVYLAVAVAVATVVLRGADRGAATLLQRELGASRSTLDRWRAWWRTLPGSAFWQRVRGAVPVGLDADALPQSLLDRLVGPPSDRMVRLLQLFSPFTVTGRVVPSRAR